MNLKSVIITFALLAVGVVSVDPLPSAEKLLETNAASGQQIIQSDKWIDANNVLMFVDNTGAFAYDRYRVSGYFTGFYYPYYGFDNIINGTSNRYVCFAAGLWFGGVDSATGDTVISVSDYSSDYWPGPMSGGTYISGADTDSLYRVYKIYSDSMSSNPNQDYLDWPVSQGAPVDSSGNPLLRGKQTLWTIFNDANSAVRTNDGSSAIGLGVEVQHTVWADTGSGSYILPGPTHLAVSQQGISGIKVTVEIIDTSVFTGHDYKVVTAYDSIAGLVWHLIDVTTNDTVLASQTVFGIPSDTITDGFKVSVLGSGTVFESIEVVANSSGPLDPPAGGTFFWQGFPSITRLDNSQQVGAGIWAFHTGDNGGSYCGGTRGGYDDFLARVLRNGNLKRLVLWDYEMRFTGDTNSSGLYDSSLGGGSIAIRATQDDLPTWVPFELWRTGRDSPDDYSDDIRMVVWQLDYGNDTTYNLESWGCSTDSVYGGLGEHSGSNDNNDPYTDLINWMLPADTTWGDQGYQQQIAKILSGNYDFSDEEVMAWTVLINWNGGENPPFNQNLPEPGTIFRLRTSKQEPIDSFTFTATASPTVTAGPKDLSLFSRYKLINKSSNTYEDFFISMWFDPDLGNGSDDFVGCDTLDDIFFTW
jgi:hypothetical protein